MKQLKIISFVLLFLFSLMSISAFDFDNNRAYYSSDSDDVSGATLIDSSADSTNATCYNMGANCILTSGILKNATLYDGTNDYVTTDSIMFPIANRAFTINVWVKFNDNSTTQGIFGQYTGAVASSEGPWWAINGGGNNLVRLYDGVGGQTNIDFTEYYTNGQWYMMTVTFDAITYRAYVDGVLKNSAVSSGYAVTDDLLYFGTYRHNDVTAGPFDGALDEYLISNKSMNSTEIAELYNGGTGFNPYDVTPPTPTINYNVTNNDYLNYQPNINLTTTSNTNMSVVFNGAAEASLCTTCNATTYSPTLVFGQNNFTFISADENGQENSSLTLFYDNVSPIINNNILSEYNVYTFDFNSSCSDYAINYCNISINSQNVDLNVSSFTATVNGNLSYTITAVDLAGNIAIDTGIVLINPFQYFRANNTFIGSFVTNFNIVSDLYTYSSSGNYVSIPVYDLGLGVHELTFYKPGFINETFNVTFNTTSALNQTIQVTPVTLSMQMFDAADFTTQLTFNVTIINSTNDSIVLNNQLNLSQQYPDLPTGDIELIVESVGYSTATFYQTLTPFTSISITGYLISENDTDIVTFTVLDQTTDLPLGDVIIEAQQLINGSYITISQAQTSESSGQTFMLLDITEPYKFIFSKDGYTQGTTNAIPGTTSYTIKLESETTSFTFIDGVSYNFLPDTGVLYDGLNYTFKGFISGVGLTQIIYNITDQSGGLLYNSSSINPTGTTFSFDFINLNASNYTSITQTLYYVKDSNSNTVSRTYTTASITNTSFIYYLKYEFKDTENEENNIWRWLIMIISIGGAGLIARKIGATGLGSSIAVIPVAFFWAYVNWMPEVFAGAIVVASMLIFVAGDFFK